MKRKMIVFLGVVMASWFGMAMLAPEPVEALGGGNCGVQGVLGFRPWYDGLCVNDSDPDIAVPAKGDEADITRFVWTIVLNVLVDLMVAIGYLALGFVIYGGYLYIMSQGDPGKVTKAKKTLINAIIGTVIALSASAVVNTIRVILGINSNDGWNQGAYTAEKIQGVFTWVYAVAGIVAVIFIIKNGLDYMLSQGDPSKIKKATQGLIYSIVGLVVVVLAAVITSFVISSVVGAGV